MAAEPETPAKPEKKIPAFFFATAKGNEPVRDWLKSELTPEERKLVGEDIKTVEWGMAYRKTDLSPAQRQATRR